MSSVCGNRKFQTKKTHARPPGPGELARARELRKRGLHLRLIEAWRPYPTNHEPQGTRHMTEPELKSLRKVINYLWRDEQRHFEDMEDAGDDAGDHIFRHLETLDYYLNREPTDDVPAEQTSEVSPFI